MGRLFMQIGLLSTIWLQHMPCARIRLVGWKAQRVHGVAKLGPHYFVRPIAPARLAHAQGKERVSIFPSLIDRQFGMVSFFCPGQIEVLPFTMVRVSTDELDLVVCGASPILFSGTGQSSRNAYARESE